MFGGSGVLEVVAKERVEAVNVALRAVVALDWCGQVSSWTADARHQRRIELRVVLETTKRKSNRDRSVHFGCNDRRKW